MVRRAQRNAVYLQTRFHTTLPTFHVSDSASLSGSFGRRDPNDRKSVRFFSGECLWEAASHSRDSSPTISNAPVVLSCLPEHQIEHLDFGDGCRRIGLSESPH